MAEEAGAGTSGGGGGGAGGHAAGGAGGASHGISSGAEHLDPRTKTNSMKNTPGMSSRVSTFELLESGMQTPMPFNKRESKIDFEDYFVGFTGHAGNTKYDLRS